MYFTKLCRFTKVIRSFSITVEISLEAQKAPAFMALNFFPQLSTPLLWQRSHPVWPWLWLPEGLKDWTKYNMQYSACFQQILCLHVYVWEFREALSCFMGQGQWYHPLRLVRWWLFSLKIPGPPLIQTALWHGSGGKGQFHISVSFCHRDSNNYSALQMWEETALKFRLIK